MGVTRRTFALRMEDIRPGDSADVTQVAEGAFVADTFHVPDISAPYFDIADVRVNGKSQFPAGPIRIPARDSLLVNYRVPIAVGDRVTVRVKNTSAEPRNFPGDRKST